MPKGGFEETEQNNNSSKQTCMSNQIKCDVCESVMIYNTQGLAKNPKAPTHKCSNPSCKYQFDKDSGQWVPSEYRTGKWVKQTPAEKFASQLEESDQQQRIKKGVQEKRDSIKWLNAINNATQIMVAKGEKFKDSESILAAVHSMAMKMYTWEIPDQVVEKPVNVEPVYEPATGETMTAMDVPFGN